jgi:ABC-2 type transport system ATP-binding protein
MALAIYGAQAMGRTNFAAFYASLPGNLTVQQNLRVFGLLCGAKGLSERIDALIGQFDLEKFRNVKCGVLSSGE